MIADGIEVYLSGFQEGLRPDPDLKVDEWADRYARIPRGAGAEHGKYRCDRTPYAREVMQCLSPQHPARRVIAKIASQLFKTQVGLNWIGATLHLAPANFLVLLPTDRLAKRVSARINKTIGEIAELRTRMATPWGRNGRNTVDSKEFPGGTLYITTAGSAANLAEVPVKYLYADEIDRWKDSVDGEGSPIGLAETRGSTYGRNFKCYYTSSPTEAGTSAIDLLYKEGDQRRYHIPCPNCGRFHILEWENMRWTPDFVTWMVCPACFGVIHEYRKEDFLAAGKWIPTAPGNGRGETVSFQLSALYAPLGWISWRSLAQQYVEAKEARDHSDNELMRVFYNTRLAVTWNDTDSHILLRQLREVSEPYALGVVPRGAVVMTAAVDTQGDRLECTLMGWGPGLERWVIDHHVIDGDPSEGATWKELDELLLAPVPAAEGAPRVILAVGVDTGGNHTQSVYDYCRSRRRRRVGGQDQRVVALRGASKPGRPIIATRPTQVDVTLRGKVDAWGVSLWIVGTDTSKDWLAARALEPRAGPGAAHYSSLLPDEFFEQLLSESRKIRWVSGRRRSEWRQEKGRRNEALDLQVYNLAMAYHLELHKRHPEWWAAQQSRGVVVQLSGAAQPGGAVHLDQAVIPSVTPLNGSGAPGRTWGGGWGSSQGGW